MNSRFFRGAMTMLIISLNLSIKAQPLLEEKSTILESNYFLPKSFFNTEHKMTHVLTGKVQLFNFNQIKDKFIVLDFNSTKSSLIPFYLKMIDTNDPIAKDFIIVPIYQNAVQEFSNRTVEENQNIAGLFNNDEVIKYFNVKFFPVQIIIYNGKVILQRFNITPSRLKREIKKVKMQSEMLGQVAGKTSLNI